MPWRRMLLLAILLNTTVARTLVQSEKLELRNGRAGSDQVDCPPLCPVLLIRALSTFHGTVSRLLQDPAARQMDWRSLLANLRGLGYDSSRRRRPSVLDTIQVLTAAPGRKRSQKAPRPTL